MPITKLNRRRSIVVLLCAILLFGTVFSTTVFADTALISSAPMTSYFETYTSTGAWTDLQTPAHWITATGEVAYCLQTSKDNPYNAGYYTIDGEEVYDPGVLTGLKAILDHGYPATTMGFSDEEARYATANAIRFWLAENRCDGVPQYLNLNVNGDWIRGKSGYETLFRYSLYLLYMARTQDTNPVEGGTLVFTPDEITLTEDASGQYFTGQVNLTKNISGDYSLMDNAPEGMLTVTGHTGTQSETLTLQVPASYAHQSCTLCAYGMDEAPAAALFFWAPASANNQRIVTYVLDSTQSVFVRGFLTINVPAPAERTGSIRITKTGDSGEALPGVSFSLYDSSKNLIESGTTDGSGQITFTGLALGDYFYQETETLSGYVLDSTMYPITVSSSDQATEVSVTNTRASGSIVVMKTDADTGEALPGVHFKLSDAQGNLVDEGDTGTDGSLSFGPLPLGTYSLVETSAPAGYVLDSAPRSVTISEHEQIVQITVTNGAAVGSISITKTDANTNAPLSGVHFVLTDSTGATVSGGGTDENGILTFSNLPLGTYTITETETRNGYVLDSTPKEVSITENGQLVEVSITNTPARGSVSITKTDSETGAALAGVHFVLRDEAGAVAAEGDTATDGTLTLSNIPVGWYTLAETATISGYVLDETRTEVHITENGQIVELSLQNDPIHSTLEIIKRDAHKDTALMGAGYRLYDSTGTQVAEGFTDAYGKISFPELPCGQYVYQEFKAPKGYLLDESRYPVSITENGTTITETRTNERRPGTLVLTKQNANGSPLAGAAFLLEYSTDQGSTWQPVFAPVGEELTSGSCTAPGLENGQLTTGADGKAVFTGLRADGSILYRLTETKAPPGMTLMADSIVVGTLPAESGNVNAEDTELIDGHAYHYTLNITATNSFQYRLPETGSSGFIFLPVFLLLLTTPVITIKSKSKKEKN